MCHCVGGGSSCSSLYSCTGNTAEACGVELSNIDAFVNTINSSATSIAEADDYDHIAVQFCPDGDSSGIQHITLNGTVKIQGTTYATDPTSGLVAGATGKDVSLTVNGGCASYYPLSPAVSVSKGSSTTVKLLFDASLFAFGGVSGGASNTNSYYNSGCVGSSSAYVCVPVTTIVSTVDSGNPTTEHYLIANTESSTSNAPTASVALYYSSSGTPIGGVQNPYRLSGSSVSWGTTMNGGLGLYPKTVDSTTVSFGEPEGSVSLADWFKNFKRSTHTGTYTYAKSGGSSADGTYSATKL